MSGLFLDPRQPLSTCSSANCKGCPVQNHLHCHFHGKDLARFLAIGFPSFIVGGIGIARLNAWLLIPWIGLIIGFFFFIEIRVMCSHCPHYAEPGLKSLQCWANYGAPKLWKYRPGPMTRMENIVFFTGALSVATYPLVFLLAGMQWLLLVLFAGASVGFGSFLYTQLCNHCMNFACPLNHVRPDARALFFARNPVVAEAWKENLRG